jgi:hypothetical protein
MCFHHFQRLNSTTSGGTICCALRWSSASETKLTVPLGVPAASWPTASDMTARLEAIKRVAG